MITITWSWLSFWVGFGSVFFGLFVLVVLLAVKAAMKAATTKKKEPSDSESLEKMLARWAKPEK